MARRAKKVDVPDLGTITWPAGTLFPVGGEPHTPTMCSHRSIHRTLHRSTTVLCYEEGTHEIARPDGSVITLGTAYRNQPFLFCEAHIARAVASIAPYGDGKVCVARPACTHEHWKLAEDGDRYDTCERCGVNRLVSERR